MAEKKEKSYVSDNAQLMTEWDWKKNDVLNFNPNKLTLGSGQKVWWKCSEGHEWLASINHRNNGRKCPYCSGKKVLKGYNDLQTLNPLLSKEWDNEKNDELSPCNISPNSHKKVWWKCSQGHEWQAEIKSRNQGNGCPYCSGYYIIKGKNDLQTVNPSLAKEWDFERNNGLTPMDVSPNSDKKFWWKCKNGHEWLSTVSNRHNGKNCPYCSSHKVLKGYNDLQTVNPNLAKQWNYERNDRLTPMDVMPNSNKKIWWKCNKGHEWYATINDRNNGTGCPICNSESHTSFPEYAIIYYLKKHNLDVVHSYRAQGYELDVYIPSKKIAIEYDGYYWHKNRSQNDLMKNQKCKLDGIKLYRIREGLPSLNDSSIDYIISKKQKGLSNVIEQILSTIIETAIDVNIERDSIAIENLREYTEKENSILFTNPKIAQEWNYEKNCNLKPEHLTANSHKKVWWRCSQGHEWQATISNRQNGNGCPYCSGRYIIKGKTDLQTVNPSLAKEWNYERNNELKPADVAPNSNQKVWWLCCEGHEWQARVQDRNSGQRCPYCSGRYVVKGKNDLLTVNPALATEWNYEKNIELTPADVKPNSNKKVWWKCNNGHEWQAKIQGRNRGLGCPYCAGQKVIKGENDLQTINPTLAKQWNHEKNTGLSPTEVLPGSDKKVWWVCHQGHEWQATINNRKNGRGCPYCAGRKKQ